jgi:hypothetical protein
MVGLVIASVAYPVAGTCRVGFATPSTVLAEALKMTAEGRPTVDTRL